VVCGQAKDGHGHVTLLSIGHPVRTGRLGKVWKRVRLLRNRIDDDGPPGGCTRAGRRSGVGQQTESVGLGLDSPSRGRNASPTKVPTIAITPHSQPCRLNDAMPPK
jgi:hypothetical protein